MSMLKAHKIRLYPNKKQTEYFEKSCGIARFAYNWGLTEWKKQYANGEKPSGYGLNKKLNSIKRQEYPWMYEVTKRAPEQSLYNLDTGYKNAFRRIKQNKPTESEENPWGFPQYKRKFKHDSFRAEDGPASRVVVDGKKIKLPKIGFIKMAVPLRFSGRIMSVIISRQAQRWFASILVDTEDITHERRDNKTCGIDLGVKQLVTLSDGTKYDGANSLEKAIKKRSRLHRELHRRKKGSNNRRKTAKKIAQMEYRIACIRNDALHKATTDIVLNNEYIGLEDLNTKGMLKNKRLARRISDQAFGEFRRQIEYKADWYGSNVIFVDRFYPSSKTCSQCGHIKEDLKLSDRIYKCDKCGFEGDRDLNAAINIKNNAIKNTVSTTGI